MARTQQICTTDLLDALKSFILSSLKFKVAPYPIIVSLDTLNEIYNSMSFFQVLALSLELAV